MNEWISVKDRLPEDERSVLLSVKGYGLIIGWWKYTKEWRPLQIEGEEVTHWTPLPEPPKR